MWSRLNSIGTSSWTKDSEPICCTFDCWKIEIKFQFHKILSAYFHIIVLLYAFIQHKISIEYYSLYHWMDEHVLAIQWYVLCSLLNIIRSDEQQENWFNLTDSHTCFGSWIWIPRMIWHKWMVIGAEHMHTWWAIRYPIQLWWFMCQHESFMAINALS